MATLNINGKIVKITDKKFDDIVVTPDDMVYTIRAQRVKLIMYYPVISIPGKDLEIVANPAVKTIATDGHSILYNPKYVDTVTRLVKANSQKILGINKDITEDINKHMKDAINELRWRIAHVLVHYAFGHIAMCDRESRQEREKWDIACDIFADNLLMRFSASMGSNIDLRFIPHVENNAATWAIDLSTEEIYMKLLAGEHPTHKKRSDEHEIWNNSNQELWSCRLAQAHLYDFGDGSDKKYGRTAILEYIRKQIPPANEDQLLALEMMQFMTGIDFTNNYSNLADDEIGSTLQRLVSRSPEDFALVAKKMAADDTLRSKMLSKPEWIQASVTHKSYIM